MTEQKKEQAGLNKIIFLVAAFALVLLAALWILWPSAPGGPARPALPQVDLEPRDIVLYFADPTGLYLVSEEEQIAGCNDERQCIAQTIEALAAGSDRLQPVIPRLTRVLGVEIEDDLIRIDLSRELVDRHPGGSLSELLTVYGLTNTLTVNFPYLRKVQILVGGKVLPTLKGHVDISQPVSAEFRYSQAPLSPAGQSDPSAGREITPLDQGDK